MKRSGWIAVFILALTACSAITSLGQPGDPNGGGTPGGEVPISGIEILVGMGGLYGAKKIHDLRKRKNS